MAARSGAAGASGGGGGGFAGSAGAGPPALASAARVRSEAGAVGARLDPPGQDAERPAGEAIEASDQLQPAPRVRVVVERQGDDQSRALGPRALSLTEQLRGDGAPSPVAVRPIEAGAGEDRAAEVGTD